MNRNFWNKKRVLITGATGFKGTWLTHLLNQLGSKVYGYSLLNKDPRYDFHRKTVLKRDLNLEVANISNIKRVKNFINYVKPDIIFHLAAQPIVSLSYINDIDTVISNINGTVNILNTLKNYDKKIAVIFVTTDKVYKNKLNPKKITFFSEKDHLGGDDIYSASKASCELIINAYNKSFFFNSKIKIATARSGNVIGGGDFSKNRIVPDIFRSQFLKKKLIIRNSNHIRPWQHVLDALNGYVVLAEYLYKCNKIDLSWNFAPKKNTVKTVADLVYKYNTVTKHKFNFLFLDKNIIHEKPLLLLNANKSRNHLNWKDKLSFVETIKYTSSWYDSYLNKENLKHITKNQITDYLKLK